MMGEGSDRMKWRRHTPKDLALETHPPGFPKAVSLVSDPIGFKTVLPPKSTADFKTERQLKVIGGEEMHCSLSWTVSFSTGDL